MLVKAAKDRQAREFPSSGKIGVIVPKVARIGAINSRCVVLFVSRLQCPCKRDRTTTVSSSENSLVLDNYDTIMRCATRKFVNFRLIDKLQYPISRPKKKKFTYPCSWDLQISNSLCENLLVVGSYDATMRCNTEKFWNFSPIDRLQYAHFWPGHLAAMPSKVFHGLILVP